ncbi:MAG: MFS transporter [Deltaproteobacteria bacterium]|nr:MFS transporter [Deltaproteobacteria bacterium]
MPHNQYSNDALGVVDKSNKLWTRTFVTFMGIGFCIFTGFNMLLPTLSLYLDAQGSTKEQIGLIFSSFALASITSRMLAARLSRRFGATNILRLGLSICFIGSFMFIIVPHPIFYALGRMMHGAGVGLTSTLTASMATQVIPPQRMAEGLGYLGLGATSALAFGPLLGLKISTVFGYNILFTSVAFCYVAGMLISLLLPRMVLASDKSTPIKGIKAYIEPKAIPSSVLILLYGATCCAVTAYLAIYCQEVGLPSAANFFAISTIGTVSARLFTGRFYDRYGHLRIIPLAVILLAMSTLSIRLLPYPTILYITAVFHGLAQGTLFPSVQALTFSSVPDDRRTVTSALFFNSFDIGIGIGTTIMGFAAGWLETFKVVYFIGVGFLVIFMVYYLYYYLIRINRRKRKKPDSVPVSV